MSQIILPPSGGGSPVNPDNTVEALGYGATGAGTTVTSGGTNTKGSPAAIGTVGGTSWAGLYLDVGMGSNSGARYLLDLSFDNASTWAVQNLFLQPGTSGAYTRIFLPLNVASGAQVAARVQSSVASATLSIAVKGLLRNADSLPLFSTVTALSVDSANTRPSTVDVGLANTFVELISSTAAGYGALLAVVADNGTLPATSQGASFAIGLGGSGSEAEIDRWGVQISTANPAIRTGASPVLMKTIPSGSRLSARGLAATPGSDAFRVALYGFN